MPKSAWLSEPLHEYIVAHSEPLDPVLVELGAETERVAGGLAMMEIAPEQGVFMEMLVRLSGARRAVEVGTFTGHSSICIARALPEDGRLLCCDVSEEWTAVARRYWDKAGVAHKIELRLAPAVETLASLPPEQGFDFAFLDADKPSYSAYYEAILARMPAGGLIVCDNVLWGGSVVDAGNQDDSTVALRAFADAVVADERVEASMIAVGDGLLLARKR